MAAYRSGNRSRWERTHSDGLIHMFSVCGWLHPRRRANLSNIVGSDTYGSFRFTRTRGCPAPLLTHPGCCAMTDTRIRRLLLPATQLQGYLLHPLALPAHRAHGSCSEVSPIACAASN
jgi:hypothetical protein